MSGLTEFFSEAFAQTIRALAGQGLHPAGPPYGKYYGMPGATADVEAGLPVDGSVAESGEVRPGSLPGGRVVEAVHVGPYDTMVETYAAVQQFFAAEGWQPAGVMWETYLSDPDEEPDPSAWRTLISWPLAGAHEDGERG